MNVLIADADGALVSAAAEISAWGHHVEVVRDGIEALRRARASRPDLVIAGLRLLRMDGLVLTAALASRAETRGVPVLLAGGPDEDHARRRADALGVRGFLRLPLSLASLQGALGRFAPAERPVHGRRRGIHR